MEKTEISGCNVDSGFNTLINEEDLRDEGCPPYPFPFSDQGMQEAPRYSMTPWRNPRLPAVSLVLLAVVLLMVDIGLGIHYNDLKGTHLTLEDTERIGHDLRDLQDTYKTAIDSMNGFKKQLDSEMSRQTQTNWEFEHQTKRKTDYDKAIARATEDIASLRYHLPITRDGCRLCPPGWILRNSMCYYFPFSNIDGTKSWPKAREFCQRYGGDLAIIDSKDKENATVTHLLKKLDPEVRLGFWMGLRNTEVKGIWKWLDGRTLAEGYWMDGEPNNIDPEVCVAVYAKENFFKAWNDVRCDSTRMKWICEKAPTNVS
ncbi:uncharacterized protein [Pagrus major]|uniref:uncharacterized protein n=1 Tax=Pagrus major TaxID=143350 RepID=UPI003CC8C844